MDKKKNAVQFWATLAEIAIMDEAVQLHAITTGTQFEFVPVRYGRNKQHFKAALMEKRVK